MKKNKWIDYLFIVGNLSLFAGAVLQFMHITFAWLVFGAGTAIMLFLYLKNMGDLRDAEIRERRLSRNGVFAAAILAFGVYFMYTGSNSWVIALMIYAVTTLFLTFRSVKK